MCGVFLVVIIDLKITWLHMNNQKSRDPEPEVTLPEVDGFSTNYVLTEYVYLHIKPKNKVRRKKKGREMLSHELETDACA